MSGPPAPEELLRTRVSSGHFIVAFAGSRTDDFPMKSSHSTQEARTMPATLFSVTLDVLHNGDSHGTITEVVEADTAAAAETQLVDQAREMLPSGRSVHPLLTVQLTVDREHRFAEGDQIAHVDSPTTSGAVVEALTWKVSDANVAYPTYTLMDIEDWMSPPIEGVLDTDDLVPFNREGR